MADEIDKAQENIEVYNRTALLNRKRDTYQVAPIGECHYCGEELEGGQLYCNGDHAKKHHHQLKLRGLV